MELKEFKKIEKLEEGLYTIEYNEFLELDVFVEVDTETSKEEGGEPDEILSITKVRNIHIDDVVLNTPLNLGNKVFLNEVEQVEIKNILWDYIENNEI